MDADEIQDFIIVRKDNSIVHGITKGIIIDEKLNIKMYLDKDKGLYCPNKFIDNEYRVGKRNTYIIDFKKIGLRKNEVRCIRLNFSDNDDGILFGISAHKKWITEYKLNDKKAMKYVSGFDFQLIDNDGNIIGLPEWVYNKKDAPYLGNRLVSKNHIITKDKVSITFNYFFGNDTPAKAFKDIKEMIESYRKNKSKGIVVKAINE